MRAVIYTFDFDPITVVEIEPNLYRHLEENLWLRLAVIKPLPSLLAGRQPIAADFDDWIVNLKAEPFQIYGKHQLLIFTGDEESALLLKSAFLPGQQRELHSVANKAFARGFLKALTLPL